MINRLREMLDELTTERVYAELEAKNVNGFLKEWKREVVHLCDEIEEALIVEWMTDGSLPKKTGRYKTTVFDTHTKDKEVIDLYWNGSWWALAGGAAPIGDRYEVLGWKGRDIPLC